MTGAVIAVGQVERQAGQYGDAEYSHTNQYYRPFLHISRIIQLCCNAV